VRLVLPRNLGAATAASRVAEDRNSAHWLEAHESHQVGYPGDPVRAYLADDVVVDLAEDIRAVSAYDPDCDGG
jgi:pyruvate carboxylase